MPDPQQYLRPEERELRENIQLEAEFAIDVDTALSVCNALENLSACRKIIEKHQWIWNPHPERGEGQGRYECKECHQEHRMPIAKPLWLAIKEDFFHKPSCAIAAQLAGIGEE